MTNGRTPAGWYRDPTGQADARYWNGMSWTEAVNRGGQQTNLPIDPTMAQQEPLPGTQVQLPTPAPTAVHVEQRSSGMSGGVIIGIVIALLLLVAVVVAVANSDSDSSDDSPPDTEAPAEEAPTEEAPAEDE